MAGTKAARAQIATRAKRANRHGQIQEKEGPSTFGTVHESPGLAFA
jgi:hypothetical protein